MYPRLKHAHYAQYNAGYDDFFYHIIECFRDIATALRRAGFDDDEVAGIMGQNMLQLVKRVEQLAGARLDDNDLKG